MDVSFQSRLPVWLPSTTASGVREARPVTAPISPAQGTAVPGAGSREVTAALLRAPSHLAAIDRTFSPLVPSHLIPSQLDEAAVVGVRTTALPGPVCRGAPV